ncbi:MAG TPA: GNAT family N-acetyltransferase [Alphaproteobacteria bacterium]|nr:GNAT family N-acetyltransferase [Alphaproteobacteria bacterium]
MTTEAPTNTLLRPATCADCAEIARLFLIASDGLAAYIWGRMDMPGLSLEEIGRRRYEREGVAFSYRNCLIAEADGAVIGMLHAYPMERSEPPSEFDPVLRPYSELEDYGSLYISGVALYPAWRGRGIGTRLLQAAETRARDLRVARLSLICFERNARAMALYRRLGFGEIDRRPLVPHPSLKYRDGDAVLMARQLDR